MEVSSLHLFNFFLTSPSTGPSTWPLISQVFSLSIFCTRVLIFFFYLFPKPDKPSSSRAWQTFFQFLSLFVNLVLSVLSHFLGWPREILSFFLRLSFIQTTLNPATQCKGFKPFNCLPTNSGFHLFHDIGRLVIMKQVPNFFIYFIFLLWTETEV